MTAAVDSPTGFRAGRALVSALLCGGAYLVAQLHPIRDLYAPWDKYAHAFAFFTVWWAMRWSLGWRPLPLALLAAAMGGAVEIQQMFMPGFTPSWADWAADLCGIALAWALLRVSSLKGSRQA